jgi:hypothetical protein
MHAEKDLSLCLKLLALTSSELADGYAAALKLRALMARHGIGFEHLFDHVCEREDEYAYQSHHFFHLMSRVQEPQEPTEACGADDPIDMASQGSGASRTQVREHTRTSRKGRAFTVRAHWRYCRRGADRCDWRKDPAANPGEDYEWIEGHERWYSYGGDGRKIHVRGYWRRKARITLRKAA